MSNDNILLKKTKEILEKVWDDRNLFFPSSEKGLFVQRSFDSGIFSLGISSVYLDKVTEQYRTLFKGQWKNGFLPGSIFYGENDSHFPDISFWRNKKDAEYSVEGINTSGFIHPSLSGIVVWDIYVKTIENKDEKTGKKILEEFYSKILMEHEYLFSERDKEESGMITIYHPFESGFLHSKRWDSALYRISPKNLISYKRDETIDSNHYSKRDYDVLVYLAQHFLDEEYDFSKSEFQVKDLLSSCLMYISNKKLRRMAGILGKDTSKIDKWILQFEMNFLKMFFDEESKLFCDYDLVMGEKIKADALLSQTTLITGLMSSEFLERSVEIFMDKIFPEIKKMKISNISDEMIILIFILVKGFDEYGADYKNLRKIRGVLVDSLKIRFDDIREGKKGDEFEYVFCGLLAGILEEGS